MSVTAMRRCPSVRNSRSSISSAIATAFRRCSMALWKSPSKSKVTVAEMKATLTCSDGSRSLEARAPGCIEPLSCLGWASLALVDVAQQDQRFALDRHAAVLVREVNHLE
jgi:hypothetical protein